jgi:DNA-binding CsgD family transcriptional regulator
MMKLTNIEFHRSVDGKDAMYRKKNSDVSETVEPNSNDIIIPLLAQTEAQFPKCYKRLKDIYGRNPQFRFLAARRMIKCNCSEFDHILDIDEQGIIHTELVACPMRGECLDEGIICLPERETVLTSREKEIALLVSDGLSNEAIAKRLFISIDAVKSHVQNCLHKLSLSNRAALSTYISKLK